MKCGTFLKVFIFLFVSLLSITLQVPGNMSEREYMDRQMRRAMNDLSRGELPISPFLKMVGVGQAVAQAVGDATCEAIQTDARTACTAAWTDYQHGALKYFNGTLCRFNNETTAGVENVLCHFRRSMGINVDVNNLPLTATKSFGGMAIVVTIIEPTEAWALTAGYEAKGTVTVNGSTYMIIYWGGVGAKSKGFMLEGFLSGGSMGGERANYMSWDLTVDTAQSVKMYSAEFPSGGYLGSAAKGAGDYRGDASIYGAIIYNKTTSAVTTQIVMIEEQRSGGTAGQFGCFKMYSSGTKNASITVAKTENSKGGTGHAVTFAAKTLNEMDGVTLTDAVATANGTGTTLANQAALESAFGIGAGANVFNISCNDLNGLGGAAAGNLFSSSRTSLVDFTKAVADVFP